MKFTSANSFKAKIKNLAKEKGLPPQQMQQIYLIEEVIRTIAEVGEKLRLAPGIDMIYLRFRRYIRDRLISHCYIKQS